jgi:Photosynthesis system II assembly factor YCF48
VADYRLHKKELRMKENCSKFCRYFFNLNKIKLKRRISVLAFIIILIFASTLCIAQGVWELQSPIPTNEDLNDIYCLPGSTIAWAVGSNGTVVKTYDGNTWAKLNSGTNSELQSVYFIDANTGWAVSIDGKIIKTTNGGSNWTAQSSGITQPLRAVQFVSKTVGWIAGDYTYENKGVILKTINGGDTWTIQTIAGYQFWNMFFVNSSTGWIVAWNGEILKQQMVAQTGCNKVPISIIFSESILLILIPDGWLDPVERFIKPRMEE